MASKTTSCSSLRAQLLTCLAGLLLGSAAAGDAPAVPPAAAWRTWESARAEIHKQRITALQRLYYLTPEVELLIAREERARHDALTNLAASNAPAQPQGIRLEAYFSENDNSAQPFWRYLPHAPTSASPPPLLVYLHGYDPFVSLATAQCFPHLMTNLAERVGALIAAPFGRGNTDYQNIGEQDVLRVIDEMQLRYRADTNRVVLVGNSMGGLGAWCIGARWAERFNALLIVSGRGDFYVWHQLQPGELPGWQRELIDTQFATCYLDRLRHTPIMALHGRHDDIVSYQQGSYLPLRLQHLGARHMRLVTFNELGHDILLNAWHYQPLQQFLETHLTTVNPKPPPRQYARPGMSGSRLQDALLEPFIFVAGGSENSPATPAPAIERAREWQRFAFAVPRLALETRLTPATAAHYHLFIFAEPETSQLVSNVLHNSGVTWTATHFTLAGRTLPRRDHGLWFAGRNPFNKERTAVVQCGLPWGEGLADNHRYDRLPDVIVYSRELDRWGLNVALAAGFIEPDETIRWSDPPFTEAIRRPPDPPLWSDLYDTDE